MASECDPQPIFPMDLGINNEYTTVKCMDFFQDSSIDYLMIGSIMQKS